MSSVLFREPTPAVDAIIEHRRLTGTDRFDEVWEGVYVVNPPPRFDHVLIADRIVELIRPLARARGLVAIREAGVGRPDDHRIPDVVVADLAALDDARHYLRTAVVAIEVLSPGGRIDKHPFYLAHGVAEVVLVDPAAATVEWFAAAADGTGYEPVEVSAVLGVGRADVAALLDG